MADKPIEATVETVASQEAWTGRDGPMVAYEVLFAGDGRTWKINLPSGEEGPASGTVLRGWKNPDKGTFGIAKDRPSQSRSTTQTGSTNGRRDDATGQSIERQVAAKAAAEMAVSAGGDAPTLIANFEAYFDIVAAKIAGQPIVKTDAETS